MFNINRSFLINFILMCLILNLSYAKADIFKNSENRRSLIISGSAVATPFTRVLAENFKKDHPLIDVFIDDSKGSIALNGLKRGAIDIALTVSALSVEEDTMLMKGFLFARGSIVVVVNQENKINNITYDQFVKVWSGEITNWKQLGGDNSELNFIIPPGDSIDLDLYKQILNNGVDPVSKSRPISTAKERLLYVTNDKNSLTIVRRREYNTIQMGKKISLNGYEANPQSVLSSLYPLYIGFFMNIYGETGQKNQDVIDFIKFAQSERGQRILEEQGQVPVR